VYYHNHHHLHHHQRLYSPRWALASCKCRQRLLSWAAVKQFLQFSLPVSSFTPSVHFDFDRPPRWPPRFVLIFLGNSLSSIRATWPAHLVLPHFITLTTYGSLSGSSNSLLHPFRHCPFSHILRRIFLSKIFSLLSSFFVTAQVSAACARNGLDSFVYKNKKVIICNVSVYGSSNLTNVARFKVHMFVRISICDVKGCSIVSYKSFMSFRA
jgi:hypothetical protein